MRNHSFDRVWFGVCHLGVSVAGIHDCSVQHHFPAGGYRTVDCGGGCNGLYVPGAKSPNVQSVRKTDGTIQFAKLWPPTLARPGNHDESKSISKENLS